MESGRSYVRGPGMTESGVNRPEARAAAAVTSLKVEPGGFSDTIGRLSSGLAGSAWSVA